MTEQRKATWEQTLNRFNERNMARRMDMDTISDEWGVQSEVRGMALQGVAYDRHDQSVEIMLGGKSGLHLTHCMKPVTGIDVLTAESPLADALRIVHAGGQTILNASAHAATAEPRNS